MDLIVAVDEKWGIGRDGGLLANVPGDMKFFKEKTTGNVVVMGRKTLESFPGKRGLPNRVNYVLTRNPEFEAERCTIVNSEEALWKALESHRSEEVFLVGGASMYNKYYDRCDTLYITKFQADLNADAHIVNIDKDDRFELVNESDVQESNGIKFTFCTYKKKA